MAKGKGIAPLQELRGPLRPLRHWQLLRNDAPLGGTRRHRRPGSAARGHSQLCDQLCDSDDGRRRGGGGGGGRRGGGGGGGRRGLGHGQGCVQLERSGALLGKRRHGRHRAAAGNRTVDASLAEIRKGGGEESHERKALPFDDPSSKALDVEGRCRGLAWLTNAKVDNKSQFKS